MGTLDTVQSKLFGGSEEQSSSTQQIFDPLFSRPQSTNLANRIQGLTLGRPDLRTPTSAYTSPYQSALLNPYTPTSAENQLLSNIMGQTSAQFANRGLGQSPIAATSVAGSIAPALINLRQQQIANLGQAQQQDIGNQAQTQQLSLQQWQQQMASLLDLLQKAGFPISLGPNSQSTGSSTRGITQGFADVAGGIGAAKGKKE